MISETESHSKENALVIDCSGTECFTGILDQNGNWLARAEAGPGALEALFPCIKNVLNASNTPLRSISRFIYCRGPGSTLGLRLGAMAINVWSHLAANPVQYKTYSSLQLTAALLMIDQPALKDALILSDWKKGQWHAIDIENGRFGEIKVLEESRVSENNLPVYHLPRRKGWQEPPHHSGTLKYSPGRLDEVLASTEILQTTTEVELFQASGSHFAKWSPQRHRAP